MDEHTYILKVEGEAINLDAFIEALRQHPYVRSLTLNTRSGNATTGVAILSEHERETIEILRRLSS